MRQSAYRSDRFFEKALNLFLNQRDVGQLQAEKQAANFCFLSHYCARTNLAGKSKMEVCGYEICNRKRCARRVNGRLLRVVVQDTAREVGREPPSRNQPLHQLDLHVG